MLASLIAIMVGGGVGSALRWGISQRLNALFPLLPPGTLVANIIAGFIIGFATVFFTRLTSFSPAVKLMVTTGLCGGLSTFSTFSEEVFSHLQNEDYIWAGTEIAVHVLFSLLAVYTGFLIASFIIYWYR
ncbi:fluoride efflux transporter CrcB [Citrobacter freundii complex sp. 2024EL-00228]|jgi:CrcB protein|uniref:Fluoride-specific ion channel FluC n=1 Tax=Citrobacter freundii TaxID=546 RepID=A0A9P3Z4Y1_CITFR|nr:MULTISPECIES: fluoride efflux transporter CrcB [Citrobacter]ANZ86287.1 camphor resistance protein CrcB [Citrobacter freundii]EIN8655622.1 fluoride efflux transporter CrcB [Citrobacter freundii]EIX7371831.1 fluoride efflux transporter CrcB [Citrobacter freundii]EJC8212884.1 fluoride efflux transporter CrcB [Citrobacter freundii]EJD6421760.1 fluoride efflux transporter CrcB [Citrobacter freundii]